MNVTTQYVVTQTERMPQKSVSDLLGQYNRVRIVDELDNTVALVEMPVEVQQQVARDHPELIFEQNLGYKIRSVAAGKFRSPVITLS